MYVKTQTKLSLIRCDKLNQQGCQLCLEGSGMDNFFYCKAVTAAWNLRAHLGCQGSVPP